MLWESDMGALCALSHQLSHRHKNIASIFRQALALKELWRTYRRTQEHFLLVYKKKGNKTHARWGRVDAHMQDKSWEGLPRAPDVGKFSSDNTKSLKLCSFLLSFFFLHLCSDAAVHQQALYSPVMQQQTFCTVVKLLTSFNSLD